MRNERSRPGRGPGRILLAVITAIMILGPGAQNRAGAQDAAAVIDALVEEGVLTVEQADRVRQRVQEQWRQQPASKVDGLKNIDKFGLLGDLRTRYEYIDQQDAFDDVAHANGDPWGDNRTQDDDRDDSSRVRYRLRFGFVAQFPGNVEFGLRLASGGDGATTSTEQTYGDLFGSDAISIDQAYIKASPVDWGTLWLGRHELHKAIYTTDLVWDTDLAAEGATEQFAWKVSDSLGLFANVVQWVYQDVGEADDDGGLSVANDGEVIDENGIRRIVQNDDGWIFGGQAGFQWDWVPKKTYARFAAGYWYFANGGDVSASTKTYYDGAPKDGSEFKTKTVRVVNLGPGSGANTTGEFQLFDAIGEIVYTPANGFLRDIPLRTYGHLVLNTAPEANWGVVPSGGGTTRAFASADDESSIDVERGGFSALGDDVAWRAGLQLGNAKKRGQWDLNAWYQRVGNNAVPDTFNDSTLAAGFTNHKGFAFRGRWAVRDWWELAVLYGDFEFLDPDLNQELNNGAQAQARVVQIDSTFRF